MNNPLTPHILAVLAVILPGPLRAQPAQPKPAAAPAYQLQIGDVLLFHVREDPVIAPHLNEIQINAQGNAHFPVSTGFELLVTLQARGKTLPQLRQELEKRFLAGYYEKATIDLKLKEAALRPAKVLLFGAVRSNFLQLDPRQPLTIFEGVYQAGVNEFANLKKVKLSRLNPKTGKTETHTINLEDIKKGDRSQDIPLQDGDRIEVPERSIVF